MRRAEKSDIEFLHGNNLAMAAETEDLGLDAAVLRQGIEYLFAHPAEGLYLVAEQSASPAGSLMVTFEWSDWRAGRFWWIQSVYVAPQFRRLGVYRAMHHAVRELARQDEQSCGIRLYVERENTGAQATYDAMGMVETHYRLYEETF